MLGISDEEMVKSRSLAFSALRPVQYRELGRVATQVFHISPDQGPKFHQMPSFHWISTAK